MAVPAAALRQAQRQNENLRAGFVAAQQLRLARDHRLGPLANRAALTRLALEDRWEGAFGQLLDASFNRLDIGAGIRAASWAPPPPEPPEGLVAGREEDLERVEKRLTGPRPADMDAVEKWPGMRGIYGMNALMQQGKGKYDVKVLRGPSGEPLAVAAFEKGADDLLVDLLASAPGGGHGTRMMQELASQAAREGLGVNLVASSPESAGFYRSLGMTQHSITDVAGAKPDPDGQRFRWSNKQARQFATFGGWTAPNTAEVQAAMMEALNTASWAVDGVQLYLGLAQATSVAAGQYSLDAMGLNRTFAWAHPRSMARDLFAVRGSKVIQNLHGEHMNRLTKMIVDGTAPTSPMTVQQLTKKIHDDWPKLKRWQALRIARTETAAVWTTTAANAYMANGVTHVESLVAHGPSIDVDVNGACDYCVEMAAGGPLEITGDLPPWHPNCRCDIVPVLQDPETGEEWLPPDEPWTGGAELPACGTPAAAVQLLKRRRLERMGAFIKAKTSCAIPAPDPGEAFGGNTYKKVAGDNAAAIEAMQQQVAGWADASAAKAHASELVAGDLDAYLVSEAAGTGKLNGVAALMYFEDSVHVLGVATEAGGASKIMFSVAKLADQDGLDVVVSADDISSQLLNNLKSKGFSETGALPGQYKLAHSQLKQAFKLEPELKPGAPLPDQAKAAPPVQEPKALANPENWTVKDLLEAWDNPSHGPLIKAEVEKELSSRGLTVDRAREQLREAQRAASTPGEALPDSAHTEPGGWQKASGSKFLDDWLSGTASFGAQLKRDTMNRLTGLLKRDQRWDADAVAKAYGYSATAYGVGGDEAVVSQLINNWARTSSDADSRALAIQQAAKEEFGLDVDVFPAHYADASREAERNRLIRETMELMEKPGVRDSLRAFVRQQYNLTQKVLQENGVTHVTLYRGMRSSTSEGWLGRAGFGEVTTTDNPLASWSVRFSQSKKFAGSYGHGSRSVMLRAEVPREMVIGFPGTGFGCQHEYEVVLINHGRNRAWALVAGQRDLTPEEIAEARVKYEAAEVKAKAAEQARKEAYTAWEAAGRPWRDSPTIAAKDKADKAWTKAVNERDIWRLQVERGKVMIDLETEAKYVAQIKALAPDRPARPGAKAKPVGDTSEEVRLLGKRIASMRHKLKHPEKYKRPGGWSAAEAKDLEDKIAAMEAEREALKSGQAMNLSQEDVPHIEWDQGLGGGEFADETANFGGEPVGMVGQNNEGGWNAHHKVAGTQEGFASKAEAKAWVEEQQAALGVDLEVTVTHTNIGQGEMWLVEGGGDPGTIVLGPGTGGKYNAILGDGTSQMFDTYEEALEWMKPKLGFDAAAGVSDEGLAAFELEPGADGSWTAKATDLHGQTDEWHISVDPGGGLVGKFEDFEVYGSSVDEVAAGIKAKYAVQADEPVALGDDLTISSDAHSEASIEQLKAEIAEWPKENADAGMMTVDFAEQMHADAPDEDYVTMMFLKEGGKVKTVATVTNDMDFMAVEAIASKTQSLDDYEEIIVAAMRRAYQANSNELHVHNVVSSWRDTLHGRLSKKGFVYDKEQGMWRISQDDLAAWQAGKPNVKSASGLTEEELKAQAAAAGKRAASWRHKIKANPDAPQSSIDEWTEKMNLEEAKRDELKAELDAVQGKSPAAGFDAEDFPDLPIKTDEITEKYASVTKEEPLEIAGNTHKGAFKAENPDGDQFFVKLIDPEEAKAEELASVVAEVVQAPAPLAKVVDTGIPFKQELWNGQVKDLELSKVATEWVDAPTAQAWGKAQAELHDGSIYNWEQQLKDAGIYESREGVLIGLLDVLTANTDRHGLNYLVGEGNIPIAVDHGKAFGYGATAAKPRVDDTFAKNLVKTNKYGEIYAYKENVLTKADVDYIEAGLHKIEHKFAAAGKQKEFDAMIDRLERIGKKAKGEVNLVAPL